MELKRSALYEKVKRFEVVKPQPDEGMEACLRIFFTLVMQLMFILYNGS